MEHHRRATKEELAQRRFEKQFKALLLEREKHLLHGDSLGKFKASLVDEKIYALEQSHGKPAKFYNPLTGKYVVRRP